MAGTPLEKHSSTSSPTVLVSTGCSFSALALELDDAAADAIAENTPSAQPTPSARRSRYRARSVIQVVGGLFVVVQLLQCLQL